MAIPIFWAPRLLAKAMISSHPGQAAIVFAFDFGSGQSQLAVEAFVKVDVFGIFRFHWQHRQWIRRRLLSDRRREMSVLPVALEYAAVGAIEFFFAHGMNTSLDLGTFLQLILILIIAQRRKECREGFCPKGGEREETGKAKGGVAGETNCSGDLCQIAGGFLPGSYTEAFFGPLEIQSTLEEG